MSKGLHVVHVPTVHSGDLTVYAQGIVDDIQHKTVFLTVHDVGTNYKSFVRFVDDPSMATVRENAVFLHVSIPGQEEDAADLPGEFPTLQQLGEDLVYVLDKFHVKCCIAVGDGAGANILCRFAMAATNRVLAIILVHCTSTTAGVVEYFQDALIDLCLESGVMSESAWRYLVYHKFGGGDEKATQEFVDRLKATLNLKNLSKYLYSFLQRTDISSQIGTKMDIDALLVAGALAPHLHTVNTTREQMDRKKTTLLIVDDVSDVMVEAPDHLARSLILFCKGCGALSLVCIPGMERQRTLSNSMEEADRPRGASPAKKPVK